MNKVYGAEKPSLEEALAHHGVKGQRWGVRRARPSGKSNRQLNRESRQRDRAARKADNAAYNRDRNAQIDKARARVRSGTTRQEFKDAKKQYKIDKKTIGTREARKKLQAARLKRQTDIETANQIKSGAETAGAIIGAVGSIALSTALKTAATNRSMPRPTHTAPRGGPIRVNAHVGRP